MTQVAPTVAAAAATAPLEKIPIITPSQSVPASTTGTSNLDAKATINGFLDQYGLGNLSDWAWQKFLNGEPVSQITLELRDTPEYKTRFPAMQNLSAQGRAITEAQYVSYEQQAIGLMRASGMPAGFYDQPADFTNLLENNVSISELSDRVTKAYTAVAQAPPAVQQAFQQFYGPGSSQALASYFLDPDKAEPALEKQVAAASLAGRASQVGLNVGQQFSENMANQNLSPYTVDAAIRTAGGLAGLTHNTVGEQLSGTSLSAEQLLGSQLGTSDVLAEQARLAGRAAQTAGTGAAGTAAGGANLGTTDRG